VQTNGPYGGTVWSFAVSGTNLFVSTYGGGVFLSTNNGKSWNEVNEGLTNLNVHCFAVSGINIFAGTSGGLWLRPLSEMVTAAEKPSADLPVHFNLEQNYPNPFNPITIINYQ
jgi:hypothetical protein